MVVALTALELGGLIVAVMTGLGVLIGQLTSAYVQVKASQRLETKLEGVLPVIADTHLQVTALNGQNMAERSDQEETRRATAIPEEDRTEAEAEHLRKMPDAEAVTEIHKRAEDAERGHVTIDGLVYLLVIVLMPAALLAVMIYGQL